MADSEELLRRLTAAFSKRLNPDEAALYLEKLDRFPYEQARRGVEQLISDADRWPPVSRLLQACSAAGSGTVDGQRVSPNKPWHLTDEAHTALLRQEWLIAIPDADYDEYLQHMRAAQERRDPSEQAQAKATLYRARREMIAVCSEAWEAARQAGMVTAAECEAALDELGRGGIWPQRVRELAAMLRERQARKGAA